MKEISVSKPELKAIFERSGGEAGLARILHSFYARMRDDVLIGFFFDGKDVDVIAEKQKQFLMRAMGASVSYIGKSPAKAHLELAPILAGHFDRRLRILEDVLRENGLQSEDIRNWIRFESAFRDGIQKS